MPAAEVSNLVMGMSETQFLLLMLGMTSVVILLVLWIILRLEMKMRMIEKKLDKIGDNASEMVKMGLRFFGGNK